MNMAAWIFWATSEFVDFAHLLFHLDGIFDIDMMHQLFRYNLLLSI